MRGIVLKVSSYKEYDRLLFMYTKVGKITLVAKGANKINNDLRALSQYLNLISFKEVEDKSMYNLMDAKLLNDFNNYKEDYQKMTEISIMFDLINNFVYDNDNHELIYNLLEESLINYKPEIMLSFGFKLLKIIGYALNLKPTKKNVLGFNIALGRLVYEDENYNIDLNLYYTTILLKLSYLSYDKIEEIEDKDFKILKKFLYDYYEFHTDIKINRK